MGDDKAMTAEAIEESEEVAAAYEVVQVGDLAPRRLPRGATCCRYPWHDEGMEDDAPWTCTRVRGHGGRRHVAEGMTKVARVHEEPEEAER